MSMGGGGSTNTVQQADPWKGIQPYLSDIYGRAQQQSYNVPSYYPGSTYAPLNSTQLGGMSGLLGYSGSTLPDMYSSAMGSWYGATNPTQTSAEQIGSALAPDTYQAISQAMGGMGISQPVYAPSVGVNPYAPQVNQNVYTPQIGNTNVPVPMDFYNQMMSGQVNTDIYTPLAEAATQRMIDPFLQQVLPAIRDEGIMTGAYGGSRQDLATIGATDTLQQNIGDMLAGMYGQAYGAASQQQTEGARLATEAGLGIGQLGSNQNIEQARLGLQTQQLGGQLGISNADMQMRAQELASQVGTQNANLIMQAQQMSLTGRQEEASAMLEAAGLSRDLITQAGNLQVDQTQNLLSGLSLAPQMAQLGMLPYQNMMDVGNILQGQTQQGIDDAMQRYMYNQQAPWTNLSNYASILGGIPTSGYGSTSSSTDVGTNPYANALGTGAMTYGLNAMGLMNPTWAIALPLLSYLTSK